MTGAGGFYYFFLTLWVLAEHAMNMLQIKEGIYEAQREVVNRAVSDHSVTGDTRVLQHLMAMEKTCTVSPYFGTVQRDIQPYMRRVLVEWMFRVCI